MIEKLNNFTYKSFDNYSGPDTSFVKTNIVFGYNGCGKSSFSKGIYFKGVKEYSESSVCYFDKDYINSCLTMSDDKQYLKGVKAVFGSRNVEALNSIALLENQIVEIQPIEIDINSKIDEIRLLADEKFNDIKRVSSIRNTNQFNGDIERWIQNNEDFISRAKRIEPEDKEILKYRGDDSLEKELKIIRDYNLPEIETDDLMSFDLSLLSTSYNDESIPKSTIVNWISDGVALHENETKCLFCGSNDVNLDHIKKELNRYVKNEKHNTEVKIKNAIEQIDRIIESIEKYETEKETISAMINNSVELISRILFEKERLAEYRGLFREKLDNIQLGFSVDKEDYNSVINDISNAHNKLFLLKKGVEKEKENKLENLNTLLKGAIALEQFNSEIINNKINELKQLKSKREEAELNNKLIDKKINDIKASISTTGEFAKFISDCLASLEIPLKLEIINENYFICNVDGLEISLSDISEGERNILALLYFYFDLFEDKEQTSLKNSIKLIIMDDPIYSVDRINGTYIITLITNLFSFSPQIFVLTHIWDDFCQILYRFKNNQAVNSYEIYKENGKSLIKEINTSITPYHKEFKELYDFSIKKASDITDSDIYHIPNVIRRVLEEYLSFKTCNSIIPTANNVNSVLVALYGTENVNNNKKTNISVLLSVCNRYSHDTSRSPKEVMIATKTLLSAIKENDPTHFNSMKQ